MLDCPFECIECIPCICFCFSVQIFKITMQQTFFPLYHREQILRPDYRLHLRVYKLKCSILRIPLAAVILHHIKWNQDQFVQRKEKKNNIVSLITEQFVLPFLVISKTFVIFDWPYPFNCCANNADTSYLAAKEISEKIVWWTSQMLHPRCFLCLSFVKIALFE